MEGSILATASQPTCRDLNQNLFCHGQKLFVFAFYYKVTKKQSATPSGAAASSSKSKVQRIKKMQKKGTKSRLCACRWLRFSLVGPPAAKVCCNNHPPTVCSLAERPAPHTSLFMFLAVDNNLKELRAGAESGTEQTNVQADERFQTDKPCTSVPRQTVLSKNSL